MDDTVMDDVVVDNIRDSGHAPERYICQFNCHDRYTQGDVRRRSGHDNIMTALDLA